MKCPYCGSDNLPGTKLCANCGFILRPEGLEEFNQSSKMTIRSAGTPYKTYRARSKKTTLWISIIVIVAIVGLMLAYEAFGNPYRSDAAMSALLFYSYSPPTDATEGSIRIWGDVYSLQTPYVEAVLDVDISDIYGHSSSHRIYLGVFQTNEKVRVDQLLPWPYQCYSVEDLTVVHDICTRSPSLF